MTENQQDEQPPIFGFQEQWKPFHDRHEKFFSRYPNLRELLHSAYSRAINKTGPEAIVIFMLGRLCCEEFFEILLLAANGYGVGALKLLRALYERAVTMTYLTDNPSEIDTFVNYYRVAQRKLLRAMQETFGQDVIPQEAAEEAEREYQSVRDKYMVTDCAKCGTKRPNHTWHKLDLVAMAKRTSLGKLIVPAYYVPMGHVHSTMPALLSRIEKTGLESMGFNPDAQLKEADQALHFAHNIVLAVVGSHIEYFDLKGELQKLFETCILDFKDVWNRSTQMERAE